MTKIRKIDQRYRPKVAGVDLEQSMNYIDLADVTKEFIYENYTASYLPYFSGARPGLEALAERLGGNSADSLELLQRFTTFVANEVKWAGFYHHDCGEMLAVDRDLAEEELVLSGYAWCNEQARLLVALAQVSGIPARLVFLSDGMGGGHVIVETLLADGSWLAIDQSFGYLFLKDGRPVSAYDVWADQANRTYFAPIYKKICDDVIAKLGFDLIKVEFTMATRENPLVGFANLGYCNYFIH